MLTTQKACKTNKSKKKQLTIKFRIKKNTIIKYEEKNRSRTALEQNAGGEKKIH